MAADTVTLPKGFVLESDVKPPEGFVLEEPSLEPVLTGETQIDDLLPPEESQQLKELLDLSDDPQRERENITNTLYFANAFFEDPDDVSLALDEIMKKTQFNPVKSKPEERGFFGKIVESYRRGDAEVMADISVYETAFEGRGEEVTALTARKKLQMKEALDPIEGNFMAELVYSGVRVLPGMGKGYWSAIPQATVGMGIGALAALAAGQVPPLTLAPEEVGTVPAGAAIGIKAGIMVGSAHFWYKQGAGSMYATMRENDYDPELSKHIAGVAAIPYAIVEFLQVSALTPGMRRGALKVAQKSMLKVVGNAVKKYGAVWGTEVFEEVVQEIIQITAEDMSGYLSEKLKLPEGVSGFLIERGRRLWETTKGAMQAMALLPIPGATIDVYTGKRAIVAVEKPPEVTEKPPVEAVAPTEIETLAKELEESLKLTPERALEVASKRLAYDARKAAEAVEKLPEPPAVAITPEIPPTVPAEPEVKYTVDVYENEILNRLNRELAETGTKRQAFNMLVEELTAEERGLPEPGIERLAGEGNITARTALKMARENDLLWEMPKAKIEAETKLYKEFEAKRDVIRFDETISTYEKRQRIRVVKEELDKALAKLEKPTPTLAEPTVVKPAEVKIVPVKEIEAKTKSLRQKIHAVAAIKGLTKKALTELKKKHTGYATLTGKIAQKKITTEQLQSLLKAVQKARPKRVGYKRAITPKTEKKIQSLKENLIKKTAMTEADYAEILQKEVRGKEPRYINAKQFITETEGKDIIRRMLDEAEVIRVTEGYERAIRENNEIYEQVKILDRRIAEKPKRDPWSLESMRYYNQQAEVKTGAPFYAIYMDLLDTHLDNTKTRTATWKRLENTIGKKQLKAISGDKEAIQRVSTYIAAQSTLKERPAPPVDITDNEVKLAKEIQTVLKEYRLKARVAKFFNFYYYDQPIAEYDRYKREINKAVDIFEGKGREDLIEYLDTQEWGVVKSGYEPLEVLTQKIRPYTSGPTTVGKGHIKIRTDIEYHTQERNILQRLSSYMRQIDMLYNMSPKINAYVRLYDDNLAKFKSPGIVKENIETFIRNLKRYNIQGGMFERALSRMYSQAMRVIIMPSPVLAFRNLFQNAAFEHDKTILIDPRNKPLTNQRTEYLETYVLQTRAMIEEYFMVAEKPIWGLRFLTKLIDKVKLYPHSDIANRHWGFGAKINQVDRALEKDTAGMMKEARFDDITELEQRRALGILAKDGKEAMARYVARVHVDDIHFLYERSQRSPAEMTPLGKVLGNLMLFPRAYGEKLAHAANKILNGKTSQEQWRGLKVLFAVIGGGMVVGSIFTKVTGRKRNPYDPLEILSYQPGGLALGALAAVSKVFVDIMFALAGSKEAAYRLTSEIPKTADMFIPFYAYVLRGFEALTDQKNVDKRELRGLLELIDKEYKVRGGAYKVKRTALEKWQYFIAGAGVDQKEKKTKPARPIKRT